MGEYQLDRFTVLLVEDNNFIRQTLETLLRQLKIGRLTTAKNGEDAIEWLKLQKQDHNAGPDIIVSDLIMSPINGLLLLRWVRTAKESPNRFVPFVMLSGAADRDYVTASRDLGTTEFLAKPFSVNSVFMHLVKVIEQPRSFIATQKYFGPDRRRSQRGGAPGDKERRREGTDHVTMVYSAEKTVKAKNVSDVWNFLLPNTLKERAGNDIGTGPPTLPDSILAEAEESLERAVLDFAEWAQKYLTNLASLCDRAMENPDKRTLQFAEINELAHELRGQGGTFGYPLISVAGKMLYESTLEGCPVTDNQVDVVRAHIDMMRAVIREKISGSGGKVGKELVQSLHAAVQRYQVSE